MSIDKLPGGKWTEDEDEKKGAGAKKTLWYEFDCPSCNANNPVPDGFKAKEEISCNYCGTTFEARASDEGKLKLKEI